jgi:hypothetical protein
MAKVTGPLMSMDASGGFGGTIVFGKWKGRNTVRQLVRPSNPQSSTQESNRNQVRTGGVAQHWANMSVQLGDSRTATDKAALMLAAPSGQAWNGFLVKSMIGAGGLNYTAAATAYAALSSGEKTAWVAAADGLTPAFPGVYQTTTGGTSTTALTSGAAFFHYQWGLYVAGITTVPGATPPTYV